jgi:hypothetical protein
MYKRKYLIWACWIVIVIVIPNILNKIHREASKSVEPMEKIELEKLSTAQSFEKKAIDHFAKYRGKKVDKHQIARELVLKYSREGHKKNQALDKKLINEIRSMAAHFELASLLSPFDYYVFLVNEVSGKGFYGSIHFRNHLINQNDKFFDFYHTNRYNKDKKVRNNVKPFMDKDGYIYRSVSFTPESYIRQITIMIGFVALIFLFFLRNMKYILKSGLIRIIDTMGTPKSLIGSYFLYCGDIKSRDKFFKNLDDKSAILIDNYHIHDFDPCLKLKHLAYLAGIERPKEIYKALKSFEMDFALLDERIGKLDEEYLLFVIIAIYLSRENQFVVLNDLIKGKSRRFESVLKRILSEKTDSGKVLFYLSSEMFDTTIRAQTLKLKQFEFVSIDVNEISLR